jgi:hypothetical protein
VVVHEDAKSKDHREGPLAYGESIGAGLPNHLRAARAGPAGDPVFFLLTAVAVTVRMLSCSAQGGSLFVWLLLLSSCLVFCGCRCL